MIRGTLIDWMLQQTWLTICNQVYWAVQNEQYDTLERLIENGVDIDLAQDQSKTDEKSYENPLWEPESFFERFKNTRAYMEVSAWSSFTPLAWAASLGLDNMVQCLLDHGANIEHPCSYLCYCQDQLLEGPLDFPSCPSFLEIDEDEHCVFFPEWSPWTPLHYAICKGHESTTKLLIARGASVKHLALDSRGVTALHVATRWGKENIIDYLLENKLVNINASASRSRDITPLHIAYVAKIFSLVDKYLDLGADINIAFTGWGIFAMACGEGRFDKALQYLQRGADPGFVLEESCPREPWTAMRFIYEDRETQSAYSMHDRLALEQEIFKASGGKPPAKQALVDWRDNSRMDGR